MARRLLRTRGSRRLVVFHAAGWGRTRRGPPAATLSRARRAGNRQPDSLELLREREAPVKTSDRWDPRDRQPQFPPPHTEVGPIGLFGGRRTSYAQCMHLSVHAVRRSMLVMVVAVVGVA